MQSLLSKALKMRWYGNKTPYKILLMTVVQTGIQLFMAQDPQPPVYVRCLMQGFVWYQNQVFGQFPYKSALFAAIEETALPSCNIVDSKNDQIEAPHDPRFKIAKTMESFALSVTDVCNLLLTHSCTD